LKFHSHITFFASPYPAITLLACALIDFKQAPAVHLAFVDSPKSRGSPMFPQ
jgi:hypothetical protein